MKKKQDDEFLQNRGEPKTGLDRLGIHEMFHLKHPEDWKKTQKTHTHQNSEFCTSRGHTGIIISALDVCIEFWGLFLLRKCGIGS